MLRKLLYLQIFFLLLINYGFTREVHIAPLSIQTIAHFEGDRHREFRGDLVATLNDGSAWKVHPNDRYAFSCWQESDLIQVSKRMSSYWFKREHKFEFCNLSNGEKVRVMLVQYPMYRTFITDATTALADSYVKTYTWVDAWGFIHYDYYTIDVYHKILSLSDGTTWVIKDEGTFACFCVNDTVYMGFNTDESGISPFLISGLEREARWAWAY